MPPTFIKTLDPSETPKYFNVSNTTDNNQSVTTVDPSPIHQNTSIPINKPEPISVFTTAVDPTRQIGKRFLLKTDERDRKEHAKLLEQKVRQLLVWENPLQTGVSFMMIMTGLYLSASYSLIQMVSALLAVAIGINLVYVNVSIQIQKMLTNGIVVNPYSSYLRNNGMNWMDRAILQRNTEWVADKIDHLVRKISLIIFIENSAQSAKWIVIFYTSWTLSSIISLRALMIFGIVMLFSWAPFYACNKSLVDCRFLQLEAIYNSHLEQLQEIIEQHWGKLTSRFHMSHSGTPYSSSKPAIDATNDGSRKDI